MVGRRNSQQSASRNWVRRVSLVVAVFIPMLAIGGWSIDTPATDAVIYHLSEISATGFSENGLYQGLKVGHDDGPTHWETEKTVYITPASDGMNPPMFTWTCEIEIPRPENFLNWGWKLSPLDPNDIMGGRLSDHTVKFTALANGVPVATSGKFKID